MNAYIAKHILIYCNQSVKACCCLPEETLYFYDLTFVLSGSMTYIIDGQKYILEKNDVLFLRPGTLRKRLQGSAPVKYVSFNFTVFDNADLPETVFMKNVMTNTIHKLISIFSGTYRQPSFRPQSYYQASYYSSEKIMNLLNLILLELNDISRYSSNNLYIINMIQYIESHIYEPLSLNDVSNHVRLSKQYTSYIFKKETGNTISDYIMEKKMILAREMIYNSKLSLIEISQNLGYENYSYFSKCFKKIFKLSPKQMQLSIKQINTGLK